MEGFIASFERIWEHTKHKGRGDCSLHGATVKPSYEYFLSYCLTNSSFRFLLPPVTFDLSAHVLFVVCSTPGVPNLWYAEAFQVVREMFSKMHEKCLFSQKLSHTEKCSNVNLVSVYFLLLFNCNTCKFVHIV